MNSVNVHVAYADCVNASVNVIHDTRQKCLRLPQNLEEKEPTTRTSGGGSCTKELVGILLLQISLEISAYQQQQLREFILSLRELGM